MSRRPGPPARSEAGATAAFLASRPYRHLAGPTMPGDNQDLGLPPAQFAALLRRDMGSFGKLAAAFWNSTRGAGREQPQWLRAWQARERAGPGPMRFRVLAIGYGDGRLDLPILLGLDAFLERHVAGWKEGGQLDVLALEPNWIPPGPREGDEAAYGGSDAHAWARMQGVDHFEDAVPRGAGNVGEAGRVRIRVARSTCEEWLADARNGANGRFDMVQAFFVLHLLADWKESVAALVGRHLQERGLFVTADATDDLACVEASRDGVRDEAAPHTQWQLLWSGVHRIREGLLLPRFRHLSTRSHGLLAESLGKCGFRVASTAAPYAWHRQVPWSTVETVLSAAASGPKARTLSSLKVGDATLARLFAEQSLAFARTVRGEKSRMMYRFGLHAVAYEAPGKLGPHAERAVLRAVGGLAGKRAPAVVRRSASRLLQAADAPGVQPAALRALAATLKEEVRQSLCLGAGTDIEDLSTCSAADRLAYSLPGDDPDAVPAKLDGLVARLLAMTRRE